MTTTDLLFLCSLRISPVSLWGCANFSCLVPDLSFVYMFKQNFIKPWRFKRSYNSFFIRNYFYKFKDFFLLSYIDYLLQFFIVGYNLNKNFFVKIANYESIFYSKHLAYKFYIKNLFISRRNSIVSSKLMYLKKKAKFLKRVGVLRYNSDDDIYKIVRRKKFFRK